MPLFRTKKEAFDWLSRGIKTIDIRKGSPRNGEVAVYLSGRKVLRMNIIKKESGMLNDIVRLDNYRLIIPSAVNLGEAITYLISLYDGYQGIFTAYYIS